MRYLSLFFTLISFLLGVEFCAEPTFEDEFEGTELSSAWEASKNTSFYSSASLFSPANVKLEDGYLVLILNNTGTTDDKGTLYNATSAEVTSTLEFGYGRYEFRTVTRGLDPVTETLQLLWDGDDYYKHHEYIGFEFQQAGFMSLLSVGVTEAEQSDAYHNTEIDSSQQPVLLSLKPRFFTIEYLPESVTWYYDLENAVRQEVSAVKTLPTHEMRVVLRNWLVDQLKYNVTSTDMPIEFKLDYFKFTPIDEGGDSCDPIEIDSGTTDTPTDENSTVTGDLSELEKVIENLPAGENHLIGYSGTVTNFSIFKSVKVVWIYIDGEWQGYSPYSKIRDTLTKYEITIFSSIPAYTGFWIQK